MEASLVALIQRTSPPIDRNVPGAAGSHRVEYRVWRVYRSTRGVQAGDDVTLLTHPIPMGMSPGYELGQAGESDPFGVYLALFDWDQGYQAYRPGPFAPKVRTGPFAPTTSTVPGPLRRHPDTTGDTWLSVQNTSWGFCPPSTLPVTFTDLGGLQEDPDESAAEAWFTEEDFARQPWGALTRAGYPAKHQESLSPPYVLDGEPRFEASAQVPEALQGAKGTLEGVARSCSRHVLPLVPHTGPQVQWVVVANGEFSLPDPPRQSYGAGFSACLARQLTGWRSSYLSQARVEGEVRIELTALPNWGFDPNPHFRWADHVRASRYFELPEADSPEGR